MNRGLCAVMAVLVVVALASCSTQSRSVVADSKPQVGLCYDLTQADEITAPSNGAPAVRCAGAHTVQTFEIAVVSGYLAAWKVRPAQTALDASTGDKCTVAALLGFLGAGQRDSVTGLSIRSFYPSQDQWGNGDRSVGCEVMLHGPTGEPRSLTSSLAGILPTARSAAIRKCYLQKPGAGGSWATTGTTVPCDEPHSTQDVNAWLNVDNGDVPAAQIADMCAPYAEQLLGAAQLPAGLSASGVVRHVTNGGFQVQCSIGGASNDGHVRGAILPAANG
jgi:hypothetical protein